jgi:hypothetical protein
VGKQVMRVMCVMRVMRDSPGRYCHSLISPKRVVLLMVSCTVDGIAQCDSCAKSVTDELHSCTLFVYTPQSTAKAPP